VTLVFTNGCFDILHRGHVEYLKASKELGDYLIVGINSDSSVKRLKGLDRPVNKQEDRVAVLQAIKYVDEVIVFDEDTPYRLIKEVKPDIITKGGDYTQDNVVGNDIAKVVILPYIQGYSTTGLVNAVKGQS
jgi:D-beta-D-heptose 7-phosphate kinase/D-beta-D-heptose 1-phosphate adenosyltransferase